MNTSSQVEVVVHYCETGDSQHLSFKTWPVFADLVQQIREYAEPGISCTSIVLLQPNGSFYTSKTSPPIDQQPSPLVLFMFSRAIILDSNFTSNATPPHHHQHSDGDMDEQILSDLRENYLHRIKTQVEAGEILRLHAMKELERFAYKPSAEAVYMPYAMLMKEDFNQISTYLERLNFVETNTELGRTLLDAINLDQFQMLTNMTQQRHLVIERSMQDLRGEEAKLRDALESRGGELEWPFSSTALEDSPSSPLAELRSKQAKVTLSLFALLRNVARFDVQMQAYKKHLFFLQEHIATQRQFLNEVTKIKLFPETYKACLVEAERRRQFATKYSAAVSRVSQHLARDRDRELETREQFYQKTFKLLPVAGLIPGLEATGVVPPVEINQRPIDPMLFTHAKPLLPSSTLLAEAEQAGNNALEKELSAVEILELQAENELLRGDKGDNSNAFTKLKQQHQEEIKALEQRIRELEEFTSRSSSKPEVHVTPSNNASYMQFEEDPD